MPLLDSHIQRCGPKGDPDLFLSYLNSAHSSGGVDNSSVPEQGALV
jgi:hypothetical protein